MQTVPVVVTEEATALVVELGLQQELEANLEWVRHNVPELQRVRVKRWLSRVTEPPTPMLVIQALREFVPARLKEPPIEWSWLAWGLQTFPDPVFRRFNLDTTCGPLSEE
jgi:hypothetical protein